MRRKSIAFGRFCHGNSPRAERLHDVLCSAPADKFRGDEHRAHIRALQETGARLACSPFGRTIQGASKWPTIAQNAVRTIASG
jgi:hypothetical protein